MTPTHILLGLSLIPLAATSATACMVFINELHYDNTGADVGEFVEVAGPAGTDLTDWSIAFYNGANGTLYDTLTLDGVLPDLQAGFGVKSFAQAGIQNGAPDGLALVHGTSVLQFLSYEGTFTAVGGPADGLSSTDIGVAELSSTAVGQSIQLAGTGSCYEDFTWEAPRPGSAGFVNEGQRFSGSRVPDGGATLGLLALGLGCLGPVRLLASRR